MPTLPIIRFILFATISPGYASSLQFKFNIKNLRDFNLHKKYNKHGFKGTNNTSLIIINGQLKGTSAF